MFEWLVGAKRSPDWCGSNGKSLELPILPPVASPVPTPGSEVPDAPLEAVELA